MPTPPKPLAIRHLYSDDIGKAAEEAYFNARRLVQAGQFDAAYRIFTALVSPGPWRTSRNFAYRYLLMHDLLWLGTRLGRPVPPKDPADDNSVWVHRAFEENRGTKAYAAIGGWGEYSVRPPAMMSWTPVELAQLEAQVRPDDCGTPFGDFRLLAERELRRRLSARLVGLSEAEDPGDHAAIADALERGITLAYPREAAEMLADTSIPAALLDVLSGEHAAAAARLGRLLPKLPDSRKSDASYWFIEPYADFLASGALGNVLGIDAAGTGAYIAAFASRSPYTITTPKPKPWKTVLKAWVERLREDGLAAGSLQDTLNASEISIKPLLARAKKTQPLNTPAREEHVAALEARIGLPLPPSYRDFLLTADGLIVPDFLALLPAAQVGWLHELDPDTVKGWNQGNEDEASDEEYAVYGADQDCIHMRSRHLHQALQISTNIDGDVLLLVPAVRFEQEWEAWFLGAKNPGAYRFKSFRALMEQWVLADEQA